MKKKTLIIALVLIAVFAVGGTLAWLTQQTQEVTNTFTAGDIDITLTETGAEDTDGDKLADANEYKMIPGNVIEKDPTVTVLGGSEAAWVFVKIQTSDNFATFMTYEMAPGWNGLDGYPGVYYREVAAVEDDTEFAVIKDNKVTVKTEVTKTQLESLTDDTYPTLKVKAYAIQKDNIDDVETAWEEVNK